ncbi:MAG: prolyl oligopeptidase family serine peptidase [Gemmataceae bacterium]|nr:prolyl oligopeptidase family serine peptidase [Gemmata sp.]MDW8198738.1 prolyl oligopeptidase family serine peptidase [Gemmataceae bacterium]
MHPFSSCFSRRQWFHWAGAAAVGLSAAPAGLVAQPKKDAAPLVPLNRLPRTVHEWYVEQVRAAERKANERRARLASRADAAAYVADVRKRIAAAFGPFPEKTPLNAKTTRTLERDTYTIENVIFESRPNFFVTANLYIPHAARQKKVPGVVGSCGHSNNGKAAEAYQSFAQGLARMGYAVLIFDPIGQGERLQYAHVEKDHRPGVGVGEHLLAGNQQFLVGEFFGTWRAWDGIRALDYLLSRPEVDPQHVGITGNSGGGTMTTWLCGLESRWTMAAPSCFVTTMRRNLENELPQDTEQCPPRAIALGLDHCDFLAAMAPKPVIILAQERDYFDVRGTEDAYRWLKQLYKLLGAEENIRLFIGPTGHGYSLENREAMYRWFNRVTGISKAQTEPKLVLEKDDDLCAAPRGQVSELQSRTVFSFTQQRAEQLARLRQRVALMPLPRRLEILLQLPPRQQAPDYRILRPATNRRYPRPHATTYVIETEPPACAVVYRLSDQQHLSRPPKDNGPAILYVSHHSADAELREEPLLAELAHAEPKTAFYTCDVRGIGESRPDTCGVDQFLRPYGSDYFYAIHGLMLDRPYVGQKTFDLLRVLDWLGDIGHTQVHLVAKGWGTLPATFAALLSDRVHQVTLKNALTSYFDVATTETYTWPLSAFVPGVLGSFDLPECYEALKAKNLRQIDPWTASGPKR